MTLKEFYQALKNTHTQWRLYFSGSYKDEKIIRSYPKYACPICAVANQIRGDEKYELAYDKAAREIGLNPHVAKNIMLAADGVTRTDPVREIRANLLKTIQYQEAS